MKLFGGFFVPLVALCVLVVGLWFGWYRYVVFAFPDAGAISDAQAKTIAARGQLGDMFGGVNALFTALLLAGALYTVWLQQRQIAALTQQQAAQERDNKELARLQAMTALVSARSTLIHTRYEMGRDLGELLRDKTLDPQWTPFCQAMLIANGQSAGKDFESLGELANKLSALIQTEEGQGAV